MNIVLAILLLLQLSAPVAGQSGVITGQVRTSNGEPARDVRVAATPVQAGDAKEGTAPLVSISQTDGEGKYRLENVPPGAYHVLAGLLDRPTYYRAATQPAAAAVVRVTAGATTQGVDFALVRSAGVSVKGRVIRADGSSATQQLYMNSTSGNVYMPFNVQAERDGSFAFARVPPGRYSITLSPGFPGAKPLSITVGETDVVGLEFFVPRIRAISGEVVVSDGDPLPRLALSFTSSDATIASAVNGGTAFRLSLPEGDYRIGMSGFPFGYAVESVTHGSTDLAQEILHVGASDVSGVRIAFRAPPASAWLKVSGRVERPVGPGPVPNKVALRGSQVLQDMETSIKADGSFEFPRVLPGTYNIQPQPAGGIPSTVTINVIRNIDDLKIVLPRQIEVTGRVTVEGGGPVPYLTLSATGQDGTVSASMESSAKFNFTLREGEHRLALLALPSGYALKSIMRGATDLQIEPLRVSAPDATEVLVTLAPTSPNLLRKVSGKVSAPTGLVKVNRPRVALNGSGFNVEAAVNDDGTFEFSKLPPGSYTIRLIPGNGLVPTTITVADKDVTGISLQIPNQVSVSGRVTIDEKVPLPRASVVVDNDASIDLGNLQPDGSFTVRLPEGRHRVSITPHSNAYRVKSATLGSVDLMRTDAVINGAGPQQLSIEFQTDNASLWKKVSGRLRRFPDAALPSNRLLLLGSVIQNFEATLNPDGSFELPKVSPGAYVVFLQPVGMYSPGAEFVVADSDVTGMELTEPDVIRVPTRISIENGGSPSSKTTVLRAQVVRPIRGLNGGMVESVGDDEPGLNLVPGEYRVMTVRLPAGFTVKSMTHGSTDLLNAPLRVNESTKANIEVTLRRVDPASISGPRVGGRVKMPPAAGTPRPTTVALSAVQSGGQTFETLIAADDSFVFPHIPPDTYDARLIGPDIPTAIQQYRKQVIVTGENQDAVELTAVIWAPMRGRIVLDGAGTLPDFRSLHLGVQFRQGSFAIGDAVHPDGSFEMALVRGEFQLALDLPEAFYIKSISSRGVDLVQGRFTNDADGPREFVITLGTKPAAR